MKISRAKLEALKEFGRLVVIAAVSAGLMAAQAALGLITDPILNVLIGTFIGAVLKAWDKYVHKSESQSIGLVPF